MRKFFVLILVILLFTACNGSTGTEPPETQTQVSNTAQTSVPSTSVLTQPPLETSTPQPLPYPTSNGPDEFPEGYNPLSGLRVSDPARLEYPAILLSVSHFPAAARPQAGFSFMPFVYEYYITEGATRHVGVVYGEFPEPEIPLHGECEIRTEPMVQINSILGNRVWHDKNENGIQDPREGGIGGICVNLLDENESVIQQTTTDSNGYYGFNAPAGTYSIEIEKPSWLEFTQKNIGEEGMDSDVDQESDRIESVNVTSTSLFWDAGLVTSSDITPTPDSSVELPRAEVGPIRSGRIFYRYMGALYQDSCLIYASADPEVLAQIPGCATVAHTIQGGGAMLPLERMARISEQNKEFNPNFNYTSNLFSDEPSTGGQPALELQEYWALLNQSKWTYDAASESWWRYVDESDPDTAGVLHPEVDRLNNRQLKVENVILMFAEHIVIEPTIVDINLSPGNRGNAYLFRDGKRYDIRWSTFATEYEQETGRARPLKFINLDGSPAALKPGHTWVIIFTMQSRLDDLSNGVWRARFFAPPGAKAN